MKPLVYIFFMVMLVPVLSRASDGNQTHKGPNAEVHKYIKEQVMPVLIQKRQQFDAELNSSEKAEITQCRASLQQLRNQHKDWTKQDPKDPSPDNKFYGEKHAPNPDFEQRKSIMQRLQAIADQHSNSLQQLKTQLEPSRKQWMSDIAKLQPAPANEKENSDHPMHHGGPILPFPGSHHFEAVHFLLLPTSAAELTADDLQAGPAEATGLNNVEVNKFTSFVVLPNPASNDLQLGNDILPANNQLKIVDLQGKELMSVENVQAAQHLNVSSLASGTYLVQITSNGQSISKKIVISK